jgi:hypothetical protein
MDGSLFDYNGHIVESLKAIAGPDDGPLDGDPHDLEEKYPYLKARMDLIKSVPGWWRSMPILPGGFAVYELAQEIGFDNRILTKGPKKKSQAWMEKLECCHHHFGEDINISIVTTKGETYGKVLYDDYTPFMKAWLKHRPNGLGIMPATSYNQDFSHPNVLKFDGTNLDQVQAALEFAFNRQAGEPLVLQR